MSSTLAALFEAARQVDIGDELKRRDIKLHVVGRGERGKELVGPCPKCGGTDRFAASLSKQVFNCRGCRAAGDVIDLVKWLDGVDTMIAVKSLARDKVPPKPKRREPTAEASDYAAEQHRKARWLWSQRQPIAGTAAERYLRSRGYEGLVPATLAYLAQRKPGQHPALIAAFAIVGESEPGVLVEPVNVESVHLTLLQLDGSGKADVERPKLMVGSPLDLSRNAYWDDYLGRPIVLAPPNDMLGMAVTEGIEDALSVYAATGLGVWAAGAAGFMPSLAAAMPDWIDCVTIYAHADEAGQRGAIVLAERLRARDIETIIEGV
jgi:hypothetical protein